MAWRLLQSGPMIEVVTGSTPLPGGGSREATITRIAVADEVIKNDIGQSMRERYEAEDPYVRSIVEYGEIERDTDDDGNPTETFVPKGLQVVDEEPPATDEEARERVAAAERVAQEAADNAESAQREAADLRAQLEQVTGERDAAKAELADATDQLGSAISYGDLSKEALAAEAEQKGLTVTRSDGKDGDPLKNDYVTALEAPAGT